jgi:hypothetical protein
VSETTSALPLTPDMSPPSANNAMRQKLDRGGRPATFGSVDDRYVGMKTKLAPLSRGSRALLHGTLSHCLLLVQTTTCFDDILSGLYIAFVSSVLNIVLLHHTLGDFMKYRHYHNRSCARASRRHTSTCRKSGGEPRVANEAEDLQEGSFCTGASSV